VSDGPVSLQYSKCVSDGPVSLHYRKACRIFTHILTKFWTSGVGFLPDYTASSPVAPNGSASRDDFWEVSAELVQIRDWFAVPEILRTLAQRMDFMMVVMNITFP
jgi:hypothetical protein